MMLQKLNNDFPDMMFDVHQEPWNFSSVYSDIRHMESECLMSVPLQNYMTSESTFYHTSFADAIIVHKNANKEHAVKKASDFFDIPLTQMIAFGDDINDIDMLKIVGTGIAMGNAISSLKKIANYVTETNDNNGIAVWIYKHLIH